MHKSGAKVWPLSPVGVSLQLGRSEPQGVGLPTHALAGHVSWIGGIQAMHSYVVSDSVRDRVIRRQGKMMGHDTIEVARSALVVIDMQNYFVAERFPLE